MCGVLSGQLMCDEVVMQRHVLVDHFWLARHSFLQGSNLQSDLARHQ